VRARMIVALITLASISTSPSPLHAHPLHSTITELVEDRTRGVVRATIRVFADDFGTAVARSASGRVPLSSGRTRDAAELAYSIRVFGIQDAQGYALALRSCGVRRTGDLLWLCLEASTTQPLSSLRVRNGVLCELFDDQVNVVQATVGGDRRSLLFVRGDSYKPVR
jgi:hypothetical protein